MPTHSSNQFQSRVSSVLNKDVKQFGKNHLFDGKDDTCWTSDQGTPQWVMVAFEQTQEIKSFIMQFQGGFVGNDCHVEAQTERSNGSLVKVEPFYPEDSNSVQTFTLNNPIRCKVLKFVFNRSSDLFGRVVLYKLDIKS